MTDEETFELFKDRYGLHDAELVDGKMYLTPEDAERLRIAALDDTEAESIPLSHITNPDQFMVIKVEEKS